MTDQADITLDDLLRMTNAERMEIVRRAHAIDFAAVEDTNYLGIDLSLPPIVNKVLWKTFRKTFYRDPTTGVLRGWNVRMEQTGWDGPGKPMTDKRGEPLTFGHYQLLSAEGITNFPKGWTGPQHLDYRHAGNHWWDLGRLGYCPLVAVNEGKSDLLLGWENFRVAGINIPLPDFWALKLEGPLDHVAPVPNPPK